MPESPPALELRGVGVRYGETVALADVDLSLAQGEVVAVVGPSGCGKTSLLRAVAGLAPAAGSVRAGGRDLGALPTHRRGVGVAFQDHALFPHLDVAGNVGFGLVEAGTPAPVRRAEVARWLERMGLDGLGHERVDALSGGERQRVALARALAPAPRVLLLDEPFASLDPRLRTRLAREVVALLRERRTAALFVTHDLDEALEVGDRVAVLRAGRMVQLADPVASIESPTDPWTARFLGHENVWSGAAAAGLPGAPAAALLHAGRTRWRIAADDAREGGGGGHEADAAGTRAVPARLMGARPSQSGWRLDLEVPDWGARVAWRAHPRELPSGVPPAAGTLGRLVVPDAAWVRWDAA